MLLKLTPKGHVHLDEVADGGDDDADVDGRPVLVSVLDGWIRL
jgi:hypothetical protein